MVPSTPRAAPASAAPNCSKAAWPKSFPSTQYHPGIVRSRRPIRLTGAGHLLDGRWYVLGVRHRLAVEIDEPDLEPLSRRYEADVTLVRNDLGGDEA